MRPSVIESDEWLLATLERLLTPEQLHVVRAVKGESFWSAAVRRQYVTDEQIVRELSERFRLPVANIEHASPEARAFLPEQLARKYRVIPIAVSDANLDLATADPRDIDAERTIAFVLSRNVRMSLTSPVVIQQHLEALYRPENIMEKILAGVSSDDGVSAVSARSEAVALDIGGADGATHRPMIRLVDHLVAEAIQARASDIHLEPEETSVAVRYRIDGVLRPMMELPRTVGIPLVSRIKIMGSLDIADRLRPQDGRARVTVGGHPVDLRISTLPASLGEKVVIRILDQRATLLSLDALGLTPDEYQRIKALIDRREGVVLITGPTGSGKTTTLYSMLRDIQQRSVNIVTVEDPVEYRLPGIVQVQVNEKAGLTFAAALRSILRQDPDVILVGEIRDRETADIALQASLTGHLVLSTLHTIDAPSAIARLVDIGIEPYKIAASLKGVMAQRLLRRLCSACRAPQQEPCPERVRPWFLAGMWTIYRAVGCSQCAMTGYRGRFSVTEVLTVSREFERRVASAHSTDRLTDVARESGMRTLWDSGVEHVRSGTTSIEELMRVLDVPRISERRAIPAPEHPRVVLIDDNAATRGETKALLEHKGITVVEVTDGMLALTVIDRAAPDLVVLDGDMQRFDAWELLTQLRANSATADLPVIVLARASDGEREARAFACGATDYLIKPLHGRALVARLHAHLARRSR